LFKWKISFRKKIISYDTKIYSRVYPREIFFIKIENRKVLNNIKNIKFIASIQKLKKMNENTLLR